MSSEKIKFFLSLLSPFFTVHLREQICETEDSELQKKFLLTATVHFLHCSEFTVYTVGDWFCYYASSFQTLLCKQIYKLIYSYPCAENGLYLQKQNINAPHMTPAHKKLRSRLSGPPEEKFLRTTFPQQSLSQFNT